MSRTRPGRLYYGAIVGFWGSMSGGKGCLRRRGGQDNTVGRGQPGRRGPDTPGLKEEQHRQRTDRGAGRSRGPRLPLRNRILRGAGLERHATGGVAGPKATEGGWAGGSAANAGQRTDQALARGNPNFLQGAAGPR